MLAHVGHATLTIPLPDMCRDVARHVLTLRQYNTEGVSQTWHALHLTMNFLRSDLVKFDFMVVNL
ncbi:MAG: hypothetical protein HDS84_03055 [Bacteroidales bacterium]|nr:hypothetical protein [Bacteroidales bacterium]MBD5301542.1 hypothetical protein [Bacteroides sp.]